MLMYSILDALACFIATISDSQVYVDTVGEASRHEARLADRFPGIK